MSKLPDRPVEGSANLPARPLSAAEVEAVIRRAVELQAQEVEGGAGPEGLTEAELVRIGSELGLSPQHVQRALAEIAVQPPREEGWFGRGLGPGVVQASRLIRRPAEQVRAELDTYLRERECMVVHRRFPGHVVYREASGATAALQRAAVQVGGRYPLLGAKQLEVGVRALDEDSCYVSLAVELRSQRTGWAAGGLAAGGGLGGATAVFLGIAVAPPAALVGVPLLLVPIAAARAAYRRSHARMQGQLESLLDRLEHGELGAAAPAGWRRWFGM